MSWHVTRRDTIGMGLGLAAFGLLRGRTVRADGATPHFFLQIIVQPGADSMYMFDARPLAFSAGGKMANYAAADATPWDGANGGHALAASGALQLKPFKDRLAIVNGVHMPPGFDGHEQNVNALLSANPFGGRFFGPATSATAQPIAFLTIGDFNGGVVIANKDQSLSMGAATAPNLATQAKGLGAADAATLLAATTRAQACAAGSGQFSAGCAAMQRGLDASSGLAARLAGTQVTLGDGDGPLTKAAKVAMQYFLQGVTDVALLTDQSRDFDTHDPAGAKASPALFDAYFADLAAVLAAMKATPFDAASGLSMLDVTTVMVSAEFTRTHGQSGKPVDATGTDHNPQGNSILLLGKGIKGDQVVGATDMDQQTGGAFAPVSAAHQSLDGELLKRIGKPYDYDAGAVSAALPATYTYTDYITMAAVINTVMSVFGVAPSSWLTDNTAQQGGDHVPAKVLKKLLA